MHLIIFAGCSVTKIAIIFLGVIFRFPLRRGSMNWKDFIFSLPFDGNENGLIE